MTTAHSPAECLNCGHALLPEPYCPHCGQQEPHRLSVPHLLHELVHLLTHSDRSIFAYVPHLVLRPGQLLADYRLGRRKRYFNPFQFLLIVVGLVTLVANKLHYYDIVSQSVVARMRAGHMPEAVLTRVSAYFHAVGTYFNIWWLALLPVHALFTWLVYRSRPAALNYAESVLMQVVVGSAFQVWLLVALPTILWLTHQQPGNTTAFLQALLTLLYLVLVGRQGLGLSWAGAGWRAVLTALLMAAVNFMVNAGAFRWYVSGGH